MPRNLRRCLPVIGMNPAPNAFLGFYSPDGHWLVYRLESDGLFGLYRVHPNGNRIEEILPLSTFRPSLIDWGRSPTGGSH